MPTGKPAVAVLSVILSGCAQLVGTPSSRYDGVYELTATAAPGLEQFCAASTLNVTVRNGRLDFVVDPPDAWHGFVDETGRFHGQSGFGARYFNLADGISEPGVIGGDYQGCNYIYRFKPIRNAAAPNPAHS
jgi:hypothetical protein